MSAQKKPLTNKSATQSGDDRCPDEEEKEGEEFGELLKYTVVGYLGGILLGGLLDWLGHARSAVGGFFVRTLAGEGDGIFEGIYSIRQRLRKAAGSMAQAYGYGKLIGLFAGGIIDLLSRLAGVDIDGIEGFYIPYFYAQSDQIGANISGLFYLKKKKHSWGKTLRAYFRHPVMVSSLLVLILVPVGLLGARYMGFSPSTQVYAAVETVAANICWVPPLVGWLYGRKGNTGKNPKLEIGNARSEDE